MVASTIPSQQPPTASTPSATRSFRHRMPEHDENSPFSIKVAGPSTTTTTRTRSKGTAPADDGKSLEDELTRENSPFTFRMSGAPVLSSMTDKEVNASPADDGVVSETEVESSDKASTTKAVGKTTKGAAAKTAAAAKPARAPRAPRQRKMGGVRMTFDSPPPEPETPVEPSPASAKTPPLVFEEMLAPQTTSTRGGRGRGRGRASTRMASVVVSHVAIEQPVPAAQAADAANNLVSETIALPLSTRGRGRGRGRTRASLRGARGGARGGTLVNFDADDDDTQKAPVAQMHMFAVEPVQNVAPVAPMAMMGVQPPPAPVAASPAKAKAVRPAYCGDVYEPGVRLLKKHILGKINGRSEKKLIDLDEEYKQVHHLLEQTVVAGEGNSMLVIGARGVGKTSVSILLFFYRFDTSGYHDEIKLVRVYEAA